MNTKQLNEEILKEVYKKGFVILPSKEADNLKIVRKSAESIFQDRYFSFNNLEDFLKLSIESARQQAFKDVEKVIDKINKLIVGDLYGMRIDTDDYDKIVKKWEELKKELEKVK